MTTTLKTTQISYDKRVYNKGEETNRPYINQKKEVK